MIRKYWLPDSRRGCATEICDFPYSANFCLHKHLGTLKQRLGKISILYAGVHNEAYKKIVPEVDNAR